MEAPSHKTENYFENALYKVSGKSLVKKIYGMVERERYTLHVFNSLCSEAGETFSFLLVTIKDISQSKETWLPVLQQLYTL